MVWLWVVAVAALGGAAMVALLGVRLWRRVRVLAAELGVLSGHLAAALALLEGIGLDQAGRGSVRPSTDF